MPTLYLGPLKHPAIGIRLPEVVLEGVLSGFAERRTVGALMLSFGRETAPRDVIDAPPGVYEITRGHTGTSITEYMTEAARRADEKGLFVQIEADHLTVTSSATKAVKRISGVKGLEPIGDEEAEESLRYIFREVDEAAETGLPTMFTIDTCEAIDARVDTMPLYEVEAVFEDAYDGGEGVYERYVGRRFAFVTPGGRVFYLRFSREDVVRLAVKYRRSIDLALRIVEYVDEKVGWPHGFEIAFDETPWLTGEKDMVFLLEELRAAGVNVDFIAPNIGFEKRRDYRGDLGELGRRVERLAAIARAYSALLSIHSGSGDSPYSGKGPGVYETLVGATGGLLKYKVSGVYMELLFDLMAGMRQGSRARRLFEEAFDSVVAYLEKEVGEEGPLDSPTLRSMLGAWRKDGGGRDSRADVFRFYSFLALSLRDEGGRRWLREEILQLYREDDEFRRLYDREARLLTLRIIDGLGFGGNSRLVSPPR